MCRVNIGWAIGEEILYSKQMQFRSETCYAETEACLLGINKSKLAILQKQLLDQGNEKDYFVFESVLRGNFLVKNKWRGQSDTASALGSGPMSNGIGEGSASIDGEINRD